jgi:molecular chaperone DnaK
LGIAPSTDVNPMTAVAEGAAVFAESIDWASQSRGRKSARGAISAGGALDLSFNYIARTPEARAKIVAKLGARTPAGIEFQIDSLDTGWSSGRMALKDGASVELSLTKPGDNIFKVFVFDSNGAPVSLREDKIVIARTAASIDAIPASHSIGVEARDKVGGRLVLDYLVREGDQLPKKGKKSFKAGESLKAGSAGSIKFKLWEGEIPDPINDNRFIGMFEIKGTDFDDGVITAGAELICEFEVLDSGNIILEVSVPSISGSFQSGRNFYSAKKANSTTPVRRRTFRSSPSTHSNDSKKWLRRWMTRAWSRLARNWSRPAPSSLARLTRKQRSKRWTTCRKPSACWP